MDERDAGFRRAVVAMLDVALIGTLPALAAITADGFGGTARGHSGCRVPCRADRVPHRVRDAPDPWTSWSLRPRGRHPSGDRGVAALSRPLPSPGGRA
ncbi:hypothetical protein [Micromonospora sp. NPDC049204]|uniref:hypothetical protein n=1 Tax=Micromonospora sp. NPDC049204 TaxID=3154351 RepID=UPI0033DF4098